MRFFLFASVLLVFHSYAQQSKPVIDTAAFGRWPQLGGAEAINSTGKYVCYDVGKGAKSCTVIKSAFDTWSKTFSSIVQCTFTRDGRSVIFTQHDTLFFLQLGSDHYTFIAGVQSYNVFTTSDNEWLIYKQAESSNNISLHIRNEQTNRERVLTGNIKYYFYPKSHSLLLVRNAQSFCWYDLLKNKEEPAFECRSRSFTVIADTMADQFCFTAEDTVDHNRQLFYCARGMHAPVVLINNNTIAKEHADLELFDEELPAFNKNGHSIIFWVKAKRSIAQSNAGKSVMTIWKYSNRMMPIEQQFFDFVDQYKWSVSIATKNIAELDDQWNAVHMDAKEIGDHAIQMKRAGFTWWRQSANAFSLISLKDGQKKVIDTNVNYQTNLFLSPDEKYVVYYDPLVNNYFSFNAEDGSVKNITASIQTLWFRNDGLETDRVPFARYGCGLAAWVRNEPSVLIYDQHDIWKIDLEREKKPVNCTGYYGAKNHIIFRTSEFLEHEGAHSKNPHLILSSKDDVLLFAFDSATKACGFYPKKILGEDHSISSLILDAYYYQGGHIQKAASTNTWMIVRGSAIMTPNLYLTHDFKSFKTISDVAPEKKYNWLTSELVTWQLPNGQYNQGILYKPENFDSTKKYPVIFNYYELRTQELNQYKEPDFFGANINIPWFVSRGYLVFVPDIHYTLGQPGESAATTLVSAGKYLSQFPWVDGAKMGIQGQSFGGFETIYTVTHSHVFAAACEGAGTADIVSSYGGLYQYGPMPFFLLNEYYEWGQGRMGASLPEAPDLYVKANPILNTADVTTPLLMVHGKKDAAVSFTQATELFTSLRRMGKRVWLLEYTDAGHALVDNDAKDYTIRLTQFFDHYLKGAPVPAWMIEGATDGYELNPNAKEPQPKEVLYKGKYQQVNAQEHDH